MNSPGENDAFLLLIQNNKGIIYKVANSYCKDADDRQDVVQEIIIQLWRSFGKYDDRFKVSTWIYRIALNVAISFYRKDTRRRESRSPITDGVFNLPEESPAELESNLSLLHTFIRELKELDRALIILYLEEKPYREIGEIMGLSESNVSTRIVRIREKLRERFSEINN